MFNTIEDIKLANLAHGGHWFEPATLRFFKSRILPTVYKGKYFISSERYDVSPRRYTIREVGEHGGIDTVGEFQAYATRAEAIRAIKAL